VLAAGVSEVAAGDLSPKPVLQGKDELGGLTRSFAQMTQQLADAQQAVDKSMGQVERRPCQPADHSGQPDGRRDRAG
jgi:nitrogen fixation/metabolism regulation signal transduction histidine kinase